MKKIIQNLCVNFFNYYQNIILNLRKLKYIDIEITKSCNIQCQHCYMDAIFWKDQYEINTDQWFIFFDNLLQTYWPNIWINISWGECLVRKDIFDILGYIKQIGFKNISLITNGILLNEENIKKLDNLISSIWISLDWFEKDHNYFRNGPFFWRVVKNIQKLKEISDIRLIIKTTVFNRNYHYLENYYEFIKRLWVDWWHLFPMEPIGKWAYNKQDLMSFEEYESVCILVDKLQLKNNDIDIQFQEQKITLVPTKEFFKVKRCWAGYQFFTILSNWDIVRCLHANNSKNRDVYWNITINNVKDIWENKMLSVTQEKKEYCIKPYYLSEMKKRYWRIINK